jgi:hypothetical protein
MSDSTQAPSQSVTISPGERQPLQLSLFDLPILCCSCRRLKARNGRWLRRRVDHEWFPSTPFSHGICPTCIRRQYPSAYRRIRSATAGALKSRPNRISVSHV